MGAQKNNTNQQNQPAGDVTPTDDTPTWEYSYKNATESIDLKFRGDANQVFNQGAQAALHELINKINSPIKPTAAWIESPYHQPTYRHLQDQPMLPPAPMPALPPSQMPAPLMLAPSQESPQQTPNETIAYATYQPAPITVNPVATLAAPPVIPTTTGAKRFEMPKPLQVWGGHALMATQVALGVFLFYLIFINAPTKDRIWGVTPSRSANPTQPAKQ